MLRWERFRRESMMWKVSLLTGTKSLSDLTELPYGSIIHILDNFPMDGHVEYGPRKGNHFMHMNRFYKFMHSVVNWPEHKSSDCAPIYKDKMVLVSGAVHANLMKYIKEMMPLIKRCDKMLDIPVRNGTMGVVNYNPLFRMRVLGQRRKVRFFNFLWAVVLNKIMEAPDRQHFIHIPLENFVYEKKDFIRIFKQYNKLATIYYERPSYLFLAHFYGLLAKKMNLPPRGKLPEIEKDAEGDEKNDFSMESMHDEELTIPKLEPEPGLGDLSDADFLQGIASYMGECDPTLCAMEGLKDGENPYKLTIFEFLPVQMLEKVNLLFTVGNNYVCYNLRDVKELNNAGNTGLLRVINQINTLVRTSDLGALNDSATSETPMAPESVVQIDELQLELGNICNFTPPRTQQEIKETAELDLLQLDDVSKIIEQMPSTTTKAQREHVEKLSKAYKQTEINGVKLDKVMTAGNTGALKPEEVKTGAVKEGTLAPTATESTTSVLNKTYVEQTMTTDLANIFTSFNKQGMFLKDIKQEDTVDELNAWTTYTVSYEDTNHKTFTLRIPVPKVDKMGRAKINGVLKAMRIQRVSKPICKVSDTRVTLNSNYNKALLERNQNAAHSFIDWFSRKALFKIVKGGYDLKPIHGVCRYKIHAIPFEITELGKKYKGFDFKDGQLVFDYENRENYFPKDASAEIQAEEMDKFFWFGHRGDEHFFMDVTGLIVVKNLDSGEEVFNGAFGDFIEWLTGVTLIPPVEYIDIEWLSRRVPLIHMLGYRYGLTNMLKYCGCDYSVYERNERVDTRPTDIIIKFKDRKLIINRTPRNNALLFGGLCAFDLDDVLLEDMDDKDIYYSLLEQRKVSMNFIKGVDPFFDLFIDPITRDVLREMREPTDIRDLLLRAVSLLTTSDHLEAANEANFRYRSVEVITGLIYNEMARAYAGFKNRSPGASTKFSLSAYAIKQRLMEEPLFENIATLNPIEDIKSFSNITNGGSGGRSVDTFKIADRRFTDSAIGIVSEATTDNFKTGYNAILPANPTMMSSRGMTQRVDTAQLSPENVLSVNTLLMPGATNDDSKRANFSSIQASAVVPMNGSEVSRLRTGYEEMIAHLTRPPFAYAAEEDGVIESIDQKAGIMVVRYKNGTRHAVEFGPQYTNNSANGFFVNQEVVINDFKVGDKFKKDDILTYNKQFFQADPYNKNTVRYRTGTMANVAILDNGGTIEDASILTQPLCDKMVFNPVHVNTITITTDTVVRKFAHIGALVNSTDPLMVFDESPFTPGKEDDPAIVAELEKLNTASPKAGHTGTVVKIEALYKCPISNMTKSLQELVKHAVAGKNAQAVAASRANNSAEFLKSEPLVNVDKVGGIIDLTPTTVVLKFYIKQNKGMGVGDKLFFCNNLKSVASQIYPDYIEVEDGSLKVEAVTSGRGVLNRLIMSPFFSGICNNVLKTLEDKCLDVWFGEHDPQRHQA